MPHRSVGHVTVELADYLLSSYVRCLTTRIPCRGKHPRNDLSHFLTCNISYTANSVQTHARFLDLALESQCEAPAAFDGLSHRLLAGVADLVEGPEALALQVESAERTKKDR